MIIAGLAALITALFLGGPAEIFYLDNLEKGIKKEVVDKDRKKDIQQDIKYIKSLNKEFEKERKGDYKYFLELYADMNTTTDGLNSFFVDLQESRAVYQNSLVDQRVIIFGKIKAEEWNNILKSSITVADKNIAKAEKKASKSKEAFTKTKSKIESTVTSKEQRQNLLKGLENVVNSEKELVRKVLSTNSSQNEILVNKDSGKEELQEIVAMDSKQRAELLESLVSFHEVARENCSDEQWAQIIKTFTKEMQMSSR